MSESNGPLKKVKSPAGALESLWVDPASISPNPLNWKVHPEEQTDVVRHLFGRFNWLKPFLYNRRFERLADGHDRLQVAIEEGVKAVPVWVGDWSEEEEAEILVALDESARMAKGDPGRLNDLLRRFNTGNASLAAMLSRMADREGVTQLLGRMRAQAPLPIHAGPEEQAYPDAREAPEEDGDFAGDGAAPAPYSIPLSTVRMVQLFLTIDTLPEFNLMVEALGGAHGTGNATDTVMTVLRQAYATLENGAGAI